MKKNATNRYENSWQEFQFVARTTRWEELAQTNSDDKLTEVEADIREVCELLGGESLS
jgi:hypothetical protein